MKQIILFFVTAFCFVNIHAQSTPEVFWEDELAGLWDPGGKVIIKPAYAQIEDFSEGLAAFNLGGEWEEEMFGPVLGGGKWGFINTSGKLVIPVQYEEVGGFHEGVASVKVGEKYFFINKSGKKAFDKAFFAVGDFSEGLACAAAGEGKWGYIDRTGKWIISPRFQWASAFENGQAEVKLDDKEKWINKEGKVVK